MNAEEIVRIERTLEVELPGALRTFLVEQRDEFDPDDVSVVDDPDAIIDMTKEYRSGFVGLEPWPKTWVYLGDESDACPYYIDCTTGQVARLHKGDVQQKPLDSYPTFVAFREETRVERKADAEAEKRPLTWKDTVRFYTPAAIALVGFFVVLPLIAFGMVSLFRWLFK
jgi:hypothetical protein